MPSRFNFYLAPAVSGGRQVAALILGLLFCSCLTGVAEVLDSGTDTNLWKLKADLGGTVSISAEQSNGTPFMKLNYRLPAGSWVAGFRDVYITGPGELRFTLSNTVPTRGSLYLSDSAGRTYEHPLDWKSGTNRHEFVLPLDANTFKSVNDSMNNGTMVFPIRRLQMVFAAPTNTPAGIPATGALCWETIQIVPDHPRLSIYAVPHGGVAFPGEPAYWIVQPDLKQGGQLDIIITNDVGLSTRSKVDIKPSIKNDFKLPIDSTEPGYYAIYATLRDRSGKTIESTESAIAVVPRPQFYGQRDPSGFFGLCGVNRDPMVAEKLGCKNDRIMVMTSVMTLNNGNPDFNFSYYDQMVEADYRQHNMNVIFELDNIVGMFSKFDAETGWKHSTDILKPENIKYWTAFVKATVQHYKNEAFAFELINEPDLEIEQGQRLTLNAKASYYLDFLRTGYPTAKALAPEIPIAALDVSGVDFSKKKGPRLPFVRRVMEQGSEYVDIVSAHPYSDYRVLGTRDKVIWPEEFDTRGVLTEVSAIMAKNGRTPRVIPTEQGWGILGTNEVFGDASIQHGAIVSQSLILGKTVPGVEKMFWFMLHRHGGIEPEKYDLIRCRNFYSTNASDCRLDTIYPMPGASAYATTAYLLDHSKFHSAATGDTNPVAAWRFTRPDINKAVFVLWARNRKRYSVSLSASETASVYNMYSRRIAGGASFKIGLDFKPVFVLMPETEADAFSKSLSSLHVDSVAP